MLQKLAENHKKWVAIAYNMCKCKETANDIVQDMYMKMYDINKDVDDGYIYFVIRSIFIEQKRKQKEFAYDNEKIEYISNQIQLKIIKTNNTYEDLKKECYDNAYKKLEKHEKVIVHFSSTMGLRQFSRDSGLSIALLQKTKRKLKTLIWEETKKYEELETLSQKLQKQLE